MGAVRIMPLGGLGEIGMNSLVLEQDRERLMIDCGVTFDHGDNGIDTIHPLFDAVLDRPDDLVGLVVTHGHEDHIGALPHLLGALERAGRTRALPIWASPYAHSLCGRRLAEATSKLSTETIPVTPRIPFDVGSFRVEALAMTHSIPAATALSIETAAGVIIHSGDFKLDDEPGTVQLSDLERLGEIGEQGVALLMSDSTNALSPGTSGSEGTVAKTLEHLIERAPHRVVVGLFASNVHRVNAVARAAVTTGRKLCLLGRSVCDHVRIAQDHDVISWPSDLLVSPEIARGLARNRIIYVASGTQGEPRGALARIAKGEHRQLRLETGDHVLLSSRIIPGRERFVSTLVDALLGQGVVVHNRHTHPQIHGSGHGRRDELRRFLETARPQAFIPLHGTGLHLSQHAQLARETGVGEVLQLGNGQTAVLDAGLRLGDAFASGRVATAFGEPLPWEVIRQRRQLGQLGIVLVTASEHGVGVRTRGVPRAEEVAQAVKQVAESIVAKHRAMLPATGDLAERIRRAARRRSEELLGYKPWVEVVA